MDALYFDRAGRPVSRTFWQILSRQPGYCRVEHARTDRHGRELTVATYWLGAADADRPGEPQIFHTYAEIRRPDDPRPHWRRLWGWTTLAQARAGHQAIAAWLPAVAAGLAGDGGQPPGRLPVPVGSRQPAVRPAAELAVGTSVLSPRHLDGCLIASLPDRIDVATAAGMQERLLFLLTRRVRVLIADGSATKFCDEAGARALVRVAQAARARPADFRVVAVSPGLRRVLAATGADRQLHLYADLPAALPATPLSGAAAPRRGTRRAG